MNKNSKIYIAGHTGLVGSSIKRALERAGYNNLLTRTHKELDLTIQKETEDFFQTERPEYVFHCAARVGGIMANANYPAEFLYENLTIGVNIINSAFKSEVKKLLNLASSCIYPKFAPQPLKEEHLLTGPLEPTNEAYAIAKIAALKLCRFYNEQYGTNYITVMPTNLYGPNDNFDPEVSHVIPAMMHKFFQARKNKDDKVVLWGTGSPLREFLFVDDLGSACVFLMERYDAKDIGEFINVGSGDEISIKELAHMVSKAVSYSGEISWDSTKPDGTPRKILDNVRLKSLGWMPETSLEDGISKVFDWFINHNISL